MSLLEYHHILGLKKAFTRLTSLLIRLDAILLQTHLLLRQTSLPSCILCLIMQS